MIGTQTNSPKGLGATMPPTLLQSILMFSVNAMVEFILQVQTGHMVGVGGLMELLNRGRPSQ